MVVIVIGGGVIGLACAYYLRERGVDVVVLERGSVGAANSVRTGGGIRAQFGTQVNVRLSQESIAVWEEFEAEFGVDIEYRRIGYLFLARTEATAAKLRENVALQNNLGVPSEYLVPDEATEHCPALHHEEFAGAAYCSADGYANHHRIVQGFHETALDAAAEIHTGTTVEDVATCGGRAVGVETRRRSFDADYVVNAAGAWGGQVAALAGIDVPVAPKRRQLAVVEPPEPVPEDTAWTADLDGGAHFRPNGGGRALVGGVLDPDDDPVDADRYATQYDETWLDVVLNRAMSVAGYLGSNVTVSEGWAGLYAMTPDGHPIIEETRPGFVNAIGFSGHGLMHAPAVGQVVAELVLDGDASTVDVSALTADRFGDENPLTERTVF